MYRTACISVLFTTILLIGCGSTFVGFAFDPYRTGTVSGAVSGVAVVVVDDGQGTLIRATAVTLVTAGTATTVDVCGDQADRVPINQTVRASLSGGMPCSTLMAVVTSTGNGGTEELR